MTECASSLSWPDAFAIVGAVFGFAAMIVAAAWAAKETK